MINEFRQNLISGEWVIFATGRVRRREDFSGQKEIGVPKENCPFEDPEKSGNQVLITYPDTGNDWFAKVIKNKFPIVIEDETAELKKNGPYTVAGAKGSHEVVVYRDHDKNLSDYSVEELARVFNIFKERYLVLASGGVGRYIQIFHNGGRAGGASLFHPHSQIVTLPILPPGLVKNLEVAEKYFKENNKKIYDLIIDWELEQKTRVIFENAHFVAFCPFASKVAYEVRIFPKSGDYAHFEKMPEGLTTELAEIMRVVLKKISKGLNNTGYNFYIHTAPLDGSNEAHDFYSWHIEILPRISFDGGFEESSGIEVNVIDPDEAAKLLREIQI